MWVLLAILAVPLIEIGLFVTLGAEIGLWLTLAWVILSAAIGILILRRVATHGAVSLRRDIQTMRDPLSPIAHRVMVAMAGGLLILPGFFTDAIGLLLLIPPVRILLIKLIGRRIRVVTPQTARSTVIDGEWQEIEPESATKPSNSASDLTRH